ncbi:hypothetical protein [Nocardia sp. CC227C]|uniref:hypothetical protein n=1 Tax=Nocardia sp. CC227C TaxID=3044562 RepID=UPI00278C0F9F|nr:hypothetical protein [Nocardia sp. CC227C]
MKWRVWQVRIAVTAMLTAMPLTVLGAVATVWTAEASLTVPTFLRDVAGAVLLNPLWWLGVGFTFCDPLLRWRSAAAWYLVTPVGALVAATIAVAARHVFVPGTVVWAIGALVVFSCLLVQSWIVVDMPETTAHRRTRTPPLPAERTTERSGLVADVIPLRTNRVREPNAFSRWR